MKLAIMQPYIFPYIGYYQLIAAVDKFVVYDDVTFIKQGWINRNNILINKETSLFTIPIKEANSIKLISETKVHETLYIRWRKKFLKSINQNYSKTPYYSDIAQLIEKVLYTTNNGIASIAQASLETVANYLNLKVEWVNSSISYNNKELKGQNRIIDICKKEYATQYINPIGGVDLYNKEDFNKVGIKLNFIKSHNIEYNQNNNAFIPNLSIIDVLMYNSPEEARRLLTQFELC